MIDTDSNSPIALCNSGYFQPISSLESIHNVHQSFNRRATVRRFASFFDLNRQPSAILRKNKRALWYAPTQASSIDVITTAHGTPPTVRVTPLLEILGTAKQNALNIGESFQIRIPSYSSIPKHVTLPLERVRDIPVESKYKDVWQRTRSRMRASIALKHRLEERILFGATVIMERGFDGRLMASQLIRAQAREISKPVTQSRRWLFYPDNKYMWLWSFLYAALILETALVLPYRIAFSSATDSDASWRVADLFTDVFFMADVFKTFNTPYLDSDGQLETRRSRIALRYLKSWFFIDVVSCFPMYEFQSSLLVSGENNDPQSGGFLRLLRIPRLYRLIKVSRFLKLVQELQNQECVTRLQGRLFFKNSTLTIVVFVIVTFLLIHFMACFWFLIARVEDFPPNSWLRVDLLQAADNSDQYIASFYWAVQTLSTVGYGDLPPGTSMERVVACAWMVFSMMFVSLAVGSVSSMLAVSSGKENQKSKSLAVIDEFAAQAKISENLVKRLHDAVKFSADTEEAGSRLIESVFSELPRDLKFEVALAMHRGAAKSLPFFHDRDRAFIVMIVPFLRHLFSPQLTFIYKQDDFADEIYFIVRGSCYVMATEQNAIRRLQRGTYFGEIEVISQIPRKFSIITQLDTELLVMNARLLKKIRKHFTAIYDEMELIASVRDRLNEKAKSTLFRLLRRLKDRDPTCSLIESSSLLTLNPPSTPMQVIRVGSARLEIPVIPKRFDAFDELTKIRFRIRRLQEHAEDAQQKLRQAINRLGIPTEELRKESEALFVACRRKPSDYAGRVIAAGERH